MTTIIICIYVLLTIAASVCFLIIGIMSTMNER